MGGGSSRQTYTPPPVTPMPIEDSIATKQEAAKLASMRESDASRSANDLNEQDANKDTAITRKQLSMGEKLMPQAQPRGPMGDRPRSPRGPAPGSMMSQMGASSVVTG